MWILFGRSTSVVDPAAIQALKDMGAYLQTLKRFQVSREATGNEHRQLGRASWDHSPSSMLR
jgi:hypothetical protein